MNPAHIPVNIHEHGRLGVFHGRWPAEQGSGHVAPQVSQHAPKHRMGDAVERIQAEQFEGL